MGGFSWGFFLLNLFLLDVARPWWVNNWIFPSTFMKILCLVWGWGFFLLGNNLEFPVIIFGAILGFAFSFPRFRFGVGGFISSLGLDNFNCKMLAAQLSVLIYTLLAGLVSGLWLVGRVGCGGWVWLVGRVGDIAVHVLLEARLVWLGGLVPGLVLVGRVGWLGWVGLVRRAGRVAVLNVVVALSVLRGRRVQLSVLVWGEVGGGLGRFGWPTCSWSSWG